MIRFACPKCAKVCKALPAYAGKPSVCPQCGQRLTIPNGMPKEDRFTASPPNAPLPEALPLIPQSKSRPPEPKIEVAPSAPSIADMIHFACPACNSQMQVASQHAGIKVNCISCNQRLQVPSKPPNRTILAASIPAPAFVIEQNPHVIVTEAAPDVIDAELDAPPKRTRRKRLRDEEEDDDYDADRSRFRCPFCKTSRAPIVKSQVSTGGWVMLIVLLICCFPLFFIGLFMTEEFRVCSGCGIKIG